MGYSELPWKLHRKTGCSNRVNRFMDKPPTPWISHGEWRQLTHTPMGIALLKVAYGEKFSVEEAVRHVLVDKSMNYKARKVLATLLESGKGK